MPIKILVCDDHESIRDSVKLILNDSGYELYFACDGHETLEQVKNLKPEIILLDIKMPKLSGLDALGQIKALSPESKIIMVSGYGQSEVMEKALSRGADNYLVKSFSGKELKDIIQTTLNKA